MNHSSFLDFKKMNEAVMRSDAFHGIITAHHFVYSKGFGGLDPSVTMSNNISNGSNLSPISFRKRGGRNSLADVSKAYKEPPTISKEKKADCLSLIPYLTSKQMAELFYNSLKTAKD